jgi:hypothetical protein
MSNTATTAVIHKIVWDLPFAGKSAYLNYCLQTGRYGMGGAINGWFDSIASAEAAVLELDPCAAVVS